MDIAQISVTERGVSKVFTIVESTGKRHEFLSARIVPCHENGIVSFLHIFAFSHVRITQREGYFSVSCEGVVHTVSAVRKQVIHENGIKYTTFFV